MKIDKNLNLEKAPYPKKGLKNKRSFSLFNAAYLNLGFYLIIPLLLGVFIGYQIDKKFGTRPLYTGIFIVLGMVATFYNLYKVTKNV